MRGGRQPRHEAQVQLRAAPGPAHALGRSPRRCSARAGGRSAPWWSIEDLTQILASQRLEAWKEAVERVIHEIKNPLTPVGLAARDAEDGLVARPRALRRPVPLRDRHDPGRRARPQGPDRRVLALLAAARDARGARSTPNALVADALSPYRQEPGAAAARRGRARARAAGGRGRPRPAQARAAQRDQQRARGDGRERRRAAPAHASGGRRRRRSASRTTARASRTSSASSSRTTRRR